MKDYQKIRELLKAKAPMNEVLTLGTNPKEALKLKKMSDQDFEIFLRGIQSGQNPDQLLAQKVESGVVSSVTDSLMNQFKSTLSGAGKADGTGSVEEILRYAMLQEIIKGMGSNKQDTEIQKLREELRTSQIKAEAAQMFEAIRRLGDTLNDKMAAIENKARSEDVSMFKALADLQTKSTENQNKMMLEVLKTQQGSNGKLGEVADILKLSKELQNNNGGSDISKLASQLETVKKLSDSFKGEEKSGGELARDLISSTVESLSPAINSWAKANFAAGTPTPEEQARASLIVRGVSMPPLSSRTPESPAGGLEPSPPAGSVIRNSLKLSPESQAAIAAQREQIQGELDGLKNSMTDSYNSMLKNLINISDGDARKG